MGLLGGLAKGGMFGIAGMILSKKKKKKPKQAADAVQTPADQAATAASIAGSTAPKRQDLMHASATGLENRSDAATAPKKFGDAFRERAAMTEKEREKKPLSRRARVAAAGSGAVGRFK